VVGLGIEGQLVPVEVVEEYRRASYPGLIRPFERNPEIF